jgi:hypothetical protein
MVSTSGRKVLLQVHDGKDGHQEIPDAEMGLRGQTVLLFARCLLPEQRAKPAYPVLLSLFVIGWHTILRLWTHEVFLTG